MKWLMVGLFAMSMVSCAPGAFGPGSRSAPLRTSFTQVAKAPQNAETFVVTFGPMSAVNRSQADRALDALVIGRPQKGQTFSASVFWFRTQDIIAPKGIDLAMVAQTATREITDVGTTTYSLIDRVDLVFSVKVASDVKTGIYPILVQLTNVDDASKTGVAALNIEVTTPPVTQP